jgi:hypothetical protein
MRTTISKDSILKSSILCITISAFMLFALVFISCSDSEGIETADDSVLIAKIESASKVTVAASSLPAATAFVFNGDLADSYIESAELASGLGYKVAVVTDNEAREEAKSDVFFSEKGRQLKDSSDKRKRGRHKCFEFVFPIDFIMADGTSITLERKEDWTLLKDWHEANPDQTKRPTLVFPVDVTIEDGTVQTLLDSDELRAIKKSCKKGKDKRKCFRLVLPVSFTMEDASVIEVAEKADFKLLREWKKANPSATVRPALNFPADIKYKDGTIETVNDQTTFDTAKDSCKD